MMSGAARNLPLMLAVAVVTSSIDAVESEECARIGRKAIECGARNGFDKCCPGSKCSGDDDEKLCVQDKDYDPTADGQEEDGLPQVEIAVFTPSPSRAPVAVPTAGASSSELVMNSDDGANGQQQELMKNATGQEATGNQPFSFGNINLLRPATDGIKTSGGVHTAIFGSSKRNWNILLAPSNIELPLDTFRAKSSPILLERDPMKFTEVPSSAPSSTPSAAPTISHAPSDAPSSSPTDYLWVSEPLPDEDDMDNGYFDYNPNSPFGPSRWNKVEEQTLEGEYWDEEYSKFIEPDLDKNMCGSNSRRQSPIDVRLDQVDGQCFEYHEIRHTDGAISVHDPKVDAQILPAKLRIKYPYIVLDEDDLKNAPSWAETKTETDDIDGSKEEVLKDRVKGPSADIPKGWAYQMPVTHVDIKIPSEHYLEGRQYHAEYQIYLIKDTGGKRGAPAISILVDLDENNKPNKAFQVALDRFQKEWDRDMAKCEEKMRNERKLDAILGEPKYSAEEQSTILDEPQEVENKFRSYLRRLQDDDDKSSQGDYKYFDPWDSEIFRSIWFYGYEGSLTEPPCSEFVEWRIMDTPMTISIAQLFQLKKLLFHHVDKECKRTSTHFHGSVARPLQPYNGRMVHRCTCVNFMTDKFKKKTGDGECDRDDQDKYGFDSDIYTKEWYRDHKQYDTPAHQACEIHNECGAYRLELQKEAEERARKEAFERQQAAEKAAKEAAKEAEKAAARPPAPRPAPNPQPSGGGGGWWWAF